MQLDDTVQINQKRKILSAGILKKRAVLIILSDNFLGQSCVLDKPSVITGRDKTCEFRIDDPLISKKHCEITSENDGHFILQDLDSTNSTYLNGKVLKKPHTLTYGDRIIIGNTILRFFHEENFETK
jgi:pSer/pThr/pTyr-binding forkhead associated (FHA) protein